MKILDYVCKGCIVSEFAADSKDDVLDKLVERLVDHQDGLAHTDVFRVLKEREQLGSTGIGGGVAIPHGKLAGLDHMVIEVARSREGVPFDAVDNQPVHIIFLLLAGNDAATQYLKVLAKISRLLRTPGVYERFLSAPDEDAIRQIIEEADGRS